MGTVSVINETTNTYIPPIINVKDYGATGDGVTDDSTAIQAAIDANIGGTIEFPDGTYLASGLNSGGNNTILKSANKWGSTLLLAANEPMIDNYGSSLTVDGLSLYDFILDFDARTIVGGLSAQPFIALYTASSNIHIIGNKIINCDDSQLMWSVAASSAHSHIYIERNEIYGTLETAVTAYLYLFSVTDLYIRDNYIRNKSASILSSTGTDVERVHVSNNVFDGVVNSNILLRIADGTYSKIKNIVVSGNTVTNQGENPAGGSNWEKAFVAVDVVSGTLAEAWDISITGNTVQNGVLCQLGSANITAHNVSITGNSVSGYTADDSVIDKARTAITISAVNGCAISGNTISGFGNGFINLSSSEHITITGNKFSQSGFAEGSPTNNAGIYTTGVTDMTIVSNVFTNWGGRSDNARPAFIGTFHSTSSHDWVIDSNQFIDTRDTTSKTNSSITETELSAGTLYSHTVTTSTAHALNPGDKVTIAGATSATYNDEWLVLTTPSTTTYTFERAGTSIGNSSVSGTSVAVISTFAGVRIGDSGASADTPYNWTVSNNRFKNMLTHTIYVLATNSDEKNYQFTGNVSNDTRWEDFDVNDATPGIDSWNQYYKTANGSGTTITDFVNDGVSPGNIPDGHEIWVLVTDTNTTFDFTSSQLTGNSGVDLVADQYTLLHAIFDGSESNGKWRCFASNPAYSVLKSYAVGSLPTGVTGGTVYASDGRKYIAGTLEGAGSGTGVMVYYDGTNWITCDGGSTVVA